MSDTTTDTTTGATTDTSKEMTKDQDEILRQARERFERAAEADRENAIEAHDDLKFRVGEQWPEDVKRERESDGRTVLTINRILQFIRQVTGDIRINRPAIRVRPTGKGANRAVAEVLTGLIRHIEQVSQAQTAYTTAADSAAACGIGHFRIVSEYSDDDGFEQDIRIRRILNPFAVAWDPDAEALTREDAKYRFVTARVPLDEFKERWPDARTSDFDSSDYDRDYLGDWWDGEGVRVAEYWCKKSVVKTLHMMTDGSVLDDAGLAKARAEAAEDGAAAPEIKRTREVRTHEIVQYMLNGVEVIEGPVKWPGRHIPIVSVCGEEVHIGDRTVRSGVIRYAKDAQSLYNYMRSTAVEAGALQPKAPFIATPNQIKGHETQWREANRRNVPYLLYNPDGQAPGAPQRQLPAPIAVGFEQEAAIAADDMKATTGIYDASLGQRSNETSGKAIIARQREGDVSTYVYADNLAKAIAHAGRILVDLIPRIYTAERVVRVLGEDDREHAVRLNGVNRTRDGGQVTIDLSAGEYDVVVATGPSYSTKRAEASESMMQFVRAVPGAAALISDLVAKNMDWPGAEQIAERLRRSQPAEVLGEDAATIADPEQLLELQEKSLDMAKTRVETEGKRLANLKAEIEIAEGLAKLQQASTQQANSLAASGRGQDDSVAHLATGEMVVPRELLQGVPGLMEYLIAAFKTQGTDWRRHVVGGPNRINPKTGLAEFMFGRDDFGGDERDGMGGGIGGSDFDGPDDSGGDGGGGSGSGSGLDDFSGPDLGSSYGLGGGIDVSGSGSNHVGGNGVSALSGHPDAELGSPTGTVGGGVMPTQIVDKEHNYFRASPNYAVGLSPDDVPLYDKPVEVAGPFDVGGIGPLTRRNFDTGEIQTGNSSNIGSSIGGFLGGALGGVFGSRKGKPNEGAKGGTIVGEAMGGAVGKLFSNTDYHFPELDPSLQMAPHLEPLSDRLDSQDQNVRMQAVQELNQQRLKEVNDAIKRRRSPENESVNPSLTDLQSSTAIATQALYNDGNGFFTGPTETANYRRLLDGGLINNSGGLGTIEDDLPFQLQYLEQVLGANPDLQIVWDYLKAVGAVDTSSPEASLLGILEHRARGRDT